MPISLPPPAGLRDRFQRLNPLVQFSLFLFFACFVAFVPYLLHSADSRVFSNFIMMIMINVVIYAIASLGLNVVTGYTGQLNLGFCAFMAIGAYTTGLLMRDGLSGSGTLLSDPWPFWAAIPCGVLHAGIWGVLLGVPILRLTGDYFAIVTFGFAELAVLTARNWDSVTGGSQGLKNIPLATLGKVIFGTGPGKMGPLWLLMVALLAIGYIFTWRIVHSRVGLAWRAIAEDEIAAQSCGIDIRVYKSLAFFVSAALGGLAGSIFPLVYGGVYVSFFVFIFSVYILAYVVFGGMGSFTGSLAGGAILISALEVLRWGIEEYNSEHTTQINPESRLMLYGILLILVVRFRPEGLFPSRRVAGELRPETQRVADAVDDTLVDVRDRSLGRLG